MRLNKPERFCAHALNRTRLNQIQETTLGQKRSAPDEAGPERLCIATREVCKVEELLRFVAGPEGLLVPDLRNRLPGRGVWVRNDQALLAKAIQKKAFTRALGAGVTLPPDLIGQVDQLLERDALQMLALTNKAGAVITGFAKIAEGRARLLALVQAKDGSAAEIARLRGLCRRRAGGGDEIYSLALFDGAQLGLSLGREHVIHAAIIMHETGSAFLRRARRLTDFRSASAQEQEQSPAPAPLDRVNKTPIPSNLPVPVKDDETND
jgi:uncharacterized protein